MLESRFFFGRELLSLFLLGPVGDKKSWEVFSSSWVLSGSSLVNFKRVLVLRVVGGVTNFDRNWGASGVRGRVV